MVYNEYNSPVLARTKNIHLQTVFRIRIRFILYLRILIKKNSQNQRENNILQKFNYFFYSNLI